MSIALASQPSNRSSLAPAGRAEGAGTPERQLAHGGAQLTPVLGQLVDLRRRGWWKGSSGHYAVGLEVAEARGEDVGPDALQALAEVRVALGPVHQLADHQQRPAVSDEIKCMSHRTVLLVALGHVGKGTTS